jgi:hypothetical protein
MLLTNFFVIDAAAKQARAFFPEKDFKAGSMPELITKGRLIAIPANTRLAF